MTTTRDRDADRAEPGVVHLRVDPERCDGCPKFSKCDRRLTGQAHKCGRARGK